MISKTSSVLNKDPKALHLSHVLGMPQAFVLPYLNLFFEGFMTTEQIGLISALRPWLSAPSECIGAPVGPLVDASVVAAVGGEYGKHRMWGSIGWGALSVVAGWLIAQEGIAAGFVVYFILSIPCIAIALKLKGGAPAAATATATRVHDVKGQQQDRQAQQLARAAAEHGNHLQALCGQIQRKARVAELQDVHEELLRRLLPSTPSSLTGSPQLGSPQLGSNQSDAFCPIMTQAAHVCSCSPSLAARPSSCTRGEDPATCQAPLQLPPYNIVYRSSNCKQASRSPDRAYDEGLIKAWHAECALEALQDALPPAADGVVDGQVLAISDAGPKQPTASHIRESAEVLCNINSIHLDPADLLHEEAASEAAPSINAAAAGKSGSLAAAEGREVSGEGLYNHQPEQELLLPYDGCNKQMLPAVIENQPYSDRSDEDLVQQHDQAQAESLCRLVIRQPAILLLLWRALIIGLGFDAIGNFVFMHVERLGGTPTLFGLMLAFNILTEAPVFAFQAMLLNKLSVSFIFNASMLLLAARLAGYAVLPWLRNPWLVLPLELLHGFTFATSWGSGIVSCKQLAPPHLNTSMQGLFASMYGGVGSGLGALLGGFIMQLLGGQQLFCICSVILIGGWALGLLAELLFVKPSTSAAVPVLVQGPHLLIHMDRQMCTAITGLL
eukprot:gene2060-2380_t